MPPPTSSSATSCKKSCARSMEGPVSLASFVAGIGMSVRMALMAQNWFLRLQSSAGLCSLFSATLRGGGR